MAKISKSMGKELRKNEDIGYLAYFELELFKFR